jgi:hypothetical protein
VNPIDIMNIPLYPMEYWNVVTNTPPIIA